MTLADRIARTQTRLREGAPSNEQAVRQALVEPLLRELGWPTDDDRVVWPEYGVGGRRVDYALCHPPRKPAVFVEVKQRGQSNGADRQLFEYAFHEGVPLAIVTDGQEWHFYLPAGRGSYDERRVYKLDLAERDVEESVARLTRYLNYTAVTAGDAYRAAQADYDDVSTRREVERNLPLAWGRLLADADETLVGLGRVDITGAG